LEIKAITFDFWNTLAVDREPLKVRQIAADRMVEEIRNTGFEIDRERMLEAFSRAREVCYEYQEDMGMDFTPEEQVEWILNYLNLKVAPGMLPPLIKHYTTSLLDIPPVFTPRINEILGELKTLYKLAIICNTGRTPGWVIRRILQFEGLDGFFDVTIFSNEVGIAKPNPKIFTIAAGKLEVLPKYILHVGDDTHTDIYGASRAGFRTAWYNTKKLGKSVECDVEIGHLSEILQSIKKG
jgi:putative hydrolase of the HAD superfamily